MFVRRFFCSQLTRSDRLIDARSTEACPFACLLNRTPENPIALVDLAGVATSPVEWASSLQQDIGRQSDDIEPRL
jgi:hypothetical protein